MLAGVVAGRPPTRPVMPLLVAFARAHPRTQDNVYHFAGRPLVQAAMNGYNGALICYGQTGSGKTYTM